MVWLNAGEYVFQRFCSFKIWGTLTEHRPEFGD